MKRSVIVSVVTVLLIIIVLTPLVIFNNVSTKNNLAQPFYVGVTYGGDSISDAKLLIDKVKNYTNLFVLQSGPLMYDLESTIDICDYAVDAGLNIIISFTKNSDIVKRDTILNTAQARWGNHFLGIYYDDEPGGKMLDNQPVQLGNIFKSQDGSLQFSTSNNSTTSTITYSMSGTLTNYTESILPPRVYWGRGDNSTVNNTDEETTPTEAISPTRFYTEYFSNGTIYYTVDQTTLVYYPDGSVQDGNGQLVSNQGNITKFLSYQDIFSTLPIQTYIDAAQAYINAQKANLNELGNLSCRLFTSDYALYWWDYLAGYDTVFVELGWKLNSTQQIALCRGAANMQGKDWGAIIVWTDYEPPYLGSAQEVYDEMILAYHAGAKYVVVFNYPTYPEGNLYGILSEEHFEAMEQFWNYTNANPRENSGKVHGEVALVLPKDYGWGMRRNEYITQDNIWGLWPEDEKAPLILENTGKLLSRYGLNLDVIYADERFDYEGKYSEVYFWNTTVP